MIVTILQQKNDRLNVEARRWQSRQLEYRERERERICVMGEVGKFQQQIDLRMKWLAFDGSQNDFVCSLIDAKAKQFEHSRTVKQLFVQTQTQTNSTKVMWL